jgi:hypothetical protein
MQDGAQDADEVLLKPSSMSWLEEFHGKISTMALPPKGWCCTLLDVGVIPLGQGRLTSTAIFYVKFLSKTETLPTCGLQSKFLKRPSAVSLQANGRRSSSSTPADFLLKKRTP